MQRKLCANCGERTPFFRVRGGPVKLDDKHSLCMACYRDQNNSIKAKSNKVHLEKAIMKDEILAWSDRHGAFGKLLSEGEVVLQGTDLPDPEDPSDPEFVAKIVVTEHGAGTEIICGDKILGTGIPALNVFAWSKDNISYLKHWLFKVFDDSKIYRATRIEIKVFGTWPEQLRKRV